MSAPSEAHPQTPFGVYVHVPFCAARCDYCAFATWVDKDHLQEAYVEALHRELAMRRRDGTLRPATSVYVGGGTPSRLEPAALCGVLRSIETRPGAEVTVEVNPEDADLAHLWAYRDAGVTRISVGIQSTAPHVLASLGRRHGTGELERVAALVHEVGFASWSVDLIVGDVTESAEDLAATLRDVLSLEHPPPHVSAYLLTPEPGTPLGQDRRRHPDDDVLAGRYELVDATLERAGYRAEEISNWARPGHEARHNWLYWTGGDYEAVGCAAHRHLGGVRSWNVRTPERYVAMLAKGEDPTAGREVLDAEQRRFEAHALALRTRDGVPAESLGALGALEDLGDLVEVTDGRAVLTRRGRLLWNDLAVRLSGEPSATRR